ncbi:MAG TPA: hypothetical protein VF556_14380 [Pyrinomonadaceae bacterium]|jgi:hypothetical protein
MEDNKQGLTVKQENALLALLRHGSVRLASKETGISETTLWRYQQLPEFQSRMKKIRSAINEETTSLLQRASFRAVNRLMQLMDDENTQDAVKYASAKTILDLHFKNQELREIQESVQELKEMIVFSNTTSREIKTI